MMILATTYFSALSKEQ